MANVSLEVKGLGDYFGSIDYSGYDLHEKMGMVYTWDKNANKNKCKHKRGHRHQRKLESKRKANVSAEKARVNTDKSKRSAQITMQNSRFASLRLRCNVHNHGNKCKRRGNPS